MAAQIPDVEPTSIIAGDTVTWTKYLADYPATEWTLAYTVNGAKQYTATATAIGSGYSVTIPAATTADWDGGTYWWNARVTKDAESYTVGSGTFIVTANPANQTEGYDGRTSAKKILDAHLAAYEAYAGRIEQQYSLGAANRSFVYATKADLIAAIKFWQGEVAREEAALALSQGKNTGRNIFVRFP